MAELLPQAPRPGRITMYCLTTYKNTVIADYLALTVGGGHYYSPQHVQMEYLKESTTDVVDPKKGPARCWDIVIGKHKTLKDAAFMYTDPPEQWRDVKDRIAFRVCKKGDSGFGLYPTGEKDGVVVDESWFG